MGVLYTHSPKSPGPFPKLPKIHFLKIRKFQKNWDNRRPDVGSPEPAGDQWSPAGCGLTPGPVIFFEIFFLPALQFLRKWSTLSHWLQHMPALPRLLLETSNIHNF
jgi:hypothetical protein